MRAMNGQEVYFLERFLTGIGIPLQDECLRADPDNGSPTYPIYDGQIEICCIETIEGFAIGFYVQGEKPIDFMLDKETGELKDTYLEGVSMKSWGMACKEYQKEQANGN